MISDCDGGEDFTAEDRTRVSQGIHGLEAQPWPAPACEGFQVLPLGLPLVFFPARCSPRLPKELPRSLLVPFS